MKEMMKEMEEIKKQAKSFCQAVDEVKKSFDEICSLLLANTAFADESDAIEKMTKVFKEIADNNKKYYKEKTEATKIYLKTNNITEEEVIAKSIVLLKALKETLMENKKREFREFNEIFDFLGK